jgi:hypothetical protein
MINSKLKHSRAIILVPGKCVLMKQKARNRLINNSRTSSSMREYNIKIWKPTFLENRLPNPIAYNAFDKVIIPYVGKLLGVYYALTRGTSSQQFRQAVYQLSMPMPDNHRQVKGKIKVKN